MALCSILTRYLLFLLETAHFLASKFPHLFLRSSILVQTTGAKTENGNLSIGRMQTGLSHVILLDVRCLSRGQLLLVLLGVMRAIAGERIGNIELFGYKGLDVERIRASLPVHEGEEYSNRTKFQVREAVAAAIGKQPTVIAAICCDEKGNRLLFIGLPGASYKAFLYNPSPTGSGRLTADIMKLYEHLDQALEAAVRKGGQAAEEDNSHGYSLIRDPAARSLELTVRQWALKNEQQLMRVLASSSAAEHRRVASDALGYARQSHNQILALVHAARNVATPTMKCGTMQLVLWASLSVK